MAGALTRLYIFESDVVNLTAVAVWMANLFEHQARTWTDVELMRLATDRLHQMLGLLQRARAGRKAGHRVREHVFARIAEPVHRLHAHQQRLRRIDTPGNADNDAPDAGRPEAARQPLYLDLIDLGASFAALRRIGGHIGKALVI